MMQPLFLGQLVRLTAEDPQALGEAMNRWLRNTEFSRLLDDEPARLGSIEAEKNLFERDINFPNSFLFGIRQREGDRLIGFIGLWSVRWNEGECWVSIGIGEKSGWGRGYGTEAMRLLLGYAFGELNLRRVSLGVFEYNQRAIRSYQKAGFVIEGRRRKEIHRAGKRFDMVQMGILREEWAQHEQ